MDVSNVGLGSDTKLFVNENLTPFNQNLSWKYRELKRAGFIYSTWSSKGVVKFRQTQNEKLSQLNMTRS